jgi:hypothetical protein
MMATRGLLQDGLRGPTSVPLLTGPASLLVERNSRLHAVHCSMRERTSAEKAGECNHQCFFTDGLKIPPTCVVTG